MAPERDFDSDTQSFRALAEEIEALLRPGILSEDQLALRQGTNRGQSLILHRP